PQPSGCITLSERLERRGSCPILKRWLLQIFEAIEMRCNPIPTDHHFTWDFRIAAFVRIVEVPIPEASEPQHDEYQQNQTGDNQRSGLLRAPTIGFLHMNIIPAIGNHAITAGSKWVATPHSG